MKKLILALAALLLVAVAAWFLFFRTPAAAVPVYGLTVVSSHPHDPQAFTEGLFYRDGVLYESTGEVGTSGIRKVNPQTGAVIAEEQLPAPYFGEGVVAWKDRLFQVTWKDKAGFIYKADDLSPLGSFTYAGEGWGLTHNDKALILSDGTPTLRFLDPETQAVVSTLTVTANGCPVRQLNELEWVDGEIWANIWQTDLIARIDPATGKVRSFVDVGALGPKPRGQDNVPNGIAYDAAGKRLFVTGKLWPQLYQVQPGTATVASPAAEALTSCTP
ncbi:glutaminyl-peptide cyclotransferase [Sphingomonas hengshuiensis]|uniref:Glutamine cyclotransferase n=1 Tax=Sphingomonas hengshuiensis TaxID=1609977 RepID=A0A7U4JBI6_9SPHN|nr:glutaminyl-peptide cyclotransferase [Sphingomonas hengshuiensis]AJP73776.1 glutamine cyclotransferase [Sphingomonas hengshuiensis]